MISIFKPSSPVTKPFNKRRHGKRTENNLNTLGQKGNMSVQSQMRR